MTSDEKERRRGASRDHPAGDARSKHSGHRDNQQRHLNGGHAPIVAVTGRQKCRLGRYGKSEGRPVGQLMYFAKVWV